MSAAMDTYMLIVTTSTGKTIQLCLPMLASTWEIGVVLVKVVDEVGVLVELVDEVEVVDIAMMALFVVIVIFFGKAVTCLKSGVDDINNDSNGGAFTNCDDLMVVWQHWDCQPILGPNNGKEWGEEGEAMEEAEEDGQHKNLKLYFIIGFLEQASVLCQ